MARCAGGQHKVDINRRKEQFRATQLEVASEVIKLIDKIGIVNVVALLHALNDAKLGNIESPYSNDFKADGWFSLTDNDPDCASGVAIHVDEKLRWQERWVDISKIDFGLK